MLLNLGARATRLTEIFPPPGAVFRRRDAFEIEYSARTVVSFGVMRIGPAAISIQAATL
jgi:hypothetical protein